MTHLKHMALPSRALLVLLLGLLVGLSVVLAGVSIHARAYPASIITVSNCSTESALSTAIGSAMPGDTINFSCSGTIPITTTLTISTNLTLDGSGQTVTLDGGGRTQVLFVSGGVQFTLNHLTIAHGNSFLGGGLDNHGTVTITNSTFANNSAFLGGGLRNDGTVTITNSTFDHNSAPTNGSGLNNGGTATITNSTFSNNSASSGLANGGTATITNSTFDHNSAPNFGGGLDNFSSGTVSVTNSTFSNNLASNGGGLENFGKVTITNSTFSNNSAPNFGGFGGGLRNDGTVTITNSTFDHNSAPNGNGGGLFNGFNLGTVTITFSTFANNSASSGNGGGLFNGAFSTLKVKASIVANNTGGNCSGSLSDQGYNLESATDCGFTAGTDHQNSNPMLGPLANNGGPTQTLALLAGSPAIDQVPFSVCVATDQRGVARIDHQEPCDIGAFEFPDPTAPVLPGNIAIDATSPQGAVAIYTATDDEAIASVTCTPPSGSTFPIGDTTVTCTATDVDGVSTTGSFVVHVKGAAEQISDLISLVNSFHLSPQGIQTSFDSQLQAVQTDLAANNTAQACSDLTSFISHVKAQSGKMLTVAQANQLLAAATRIQAVLGC